VTSQPSDGAARNAAATHLWFAAMPGVFVLLWSTGWLGAKYGLPFAEPFSYLAYRFSIAAVLLALFALATGAVWPKDARQFVNAVLVGMLLHGVYLGGVFWSIAQGFPVGVSALINGLQPVLTAMLARPYLGERLNTRQWLGIMLGFSGVTLVVWHKIGPLDGQMAGAAANVIGMIGITMATLYQKRHGGTADLRSGAAIQLASAACLMWIIALAVERLEVTWTGTFIAVMAWMVLVNSLGAFSLLYILIRRGAASKVASLFYLVPPVVALEAWLLFGETMSPTAIAGMAMTALGVALVTRGTQ